MSGVYFDSVKFYANLDAGWTDISAYVIEDSVFQWGMNTYDPPTNDGMAGVGTMTFKLNNASGYFGGTNLLAGWGEGTEIYLELTFEGTAFKRFRGRVQSAPWRTAEWGGYVNVTVADWMKIAMDFPLVAPAIQTDQRADQVVTTILSGMTIQPQATDLDTGVLTFPLAFDTVRDRKAWAYSEMSKAQRSEFGPIYLIKDKTNGETLVFENQAARYGWRPLDTITYPTNDGTELWASPSGLQLLTSTGAGLLVSQATTANAEFSNTMLSNGNEEVNSGHVINYLTLTAYPSLTSGSVQVLFSLNEPIPIGSGQTVIIRGNYSNPDGGAPVNGANMITPAATTDFLVNTVNGGGGTNITADITVTPGYGSESFAHSVYNGNASSGWVNFFQCRGYGVTRYSSISEIIQDSVSVAARGERTASMDQPYNKNLTEGKWIGESIVEQHKDPWRSVRELHYCPNTSRLLMYLFLYVDVGWLIGVTSTMANVDEWFYVQNVRFELEQGGAIKKVTYAIKPALSLQA